MKNNVDPKNRWAMFNLSFWDCSPEGFKTKHKRKQQQVKSFLSSPMGFKIYFFFLFGPLPFLKTSIDDRLATPGTHTHQRWEELKRWLSIGGLLTKWLLGSLTRFHEPPPSLLPIFRVIRIFFFSIPYINKYLARAIYRKKLYKTKCCCPSRSHTQEEISNQM